jgi:uncharacterized protein YfbU (UPF0304 family)
MKLTRLERIMLINQLEIRKAIEETDDFDEWIEILRDGYEFLYDDVGGHLARDVPEADCRFVLEVLDMYRRLEDFQVSNPKVIATSDVFAHFRGFDGNNETALMAFARFLIKKQGKFAEQLAYEKGTDGFNSHMPTADVYRRMLAVWQSLKPNFPLVQSQVAAILQAATAKP